MLALPGSAYVYQGEELGLPEVADLPAEVLQDPIWEQTGRVRKGRDGCRVPLPWTTTGPSYGFGANGAWLPQPPSFAAYAVEAQDGVEGSTLELYRTALRLRRKLLDGETLRWAEDTPEGVLQFDRGDGWRCVTNLSAEPVLPRGRGRGGPRQRPAGRRAPAPGHDGLADALRVVPPVRRAWAGVR